MMKWAKERDGLIAQTRAFVNSVIAWKADTMPSPGAEAQPVAIENTFAVTPAVTLPEHAEQVEPAEELEVIEAVETAAAVEPAQALPIAELPSPKFAPPKPQPLSAQAPEFQSTERPLAKDAQKQDTMQVDVRKEIQGRVAAFQAHQQRFAREREAYFKSVLTKARSALDGKRDDSGRDKPTA
jgi:hypothetical protein